jgi:NADH-quinone oxidoreductase subunit G
VETCDAVLLLGEDVLNTAPMLGLAIRQASRNQPLEEVARLNVPFWLDLVARLITQDQIGPIFIAATGATRLDGLARQIYRAAPDDLARIGLAIAHLVDPTAPEVSRLPDDAFSFAHPVAEVLKAAKRPLIVSGPSLGSVELIHAAANAAWALTRAGKDARLCYAAESCNSLGAAMLGGGDLTAALELLRSGQADTVLIVENDLRRHMPENDFEELLSLARCVIAVDHLEQATTQRAHCVLPAATFAEAEGTLINNEGRAQRFYKVLPPPAAVQESWRWMGELWVASGRGEASPWPNFDAIVAALASEFAIFKDVPALAPPASFRQVGQKIGRQPHRYSGRTAETADQTVFEPPPPEDADSALAFSMEGTPLEPPSALIPRYWAPGWNSLAALNKFQIEVGGPLHDGDPGQRLIAPKPYPQSPYFKDFVSPFARRPQQFLVVPHHHIYGSEPLSAASAPVASLCPKPYIALNGADAAAAGIAGADQEVVLSLAGASLRLSVILDSTLAASLAAVPAGIAPFEGLDLPAWGTIAAAPAGGQRGGGGS